MKAPIEIKQEPTVAPTKQEPIRPRCEYRTRLSGTTVYPMDDRQHWNTYTRSHASRSPVKLEYDGVESPDKMLGFAAKAGGYSNAYGAHPNYRDSIRSPQGRKPKRRKITGGKTPALPELHIGDRLLQYRQRSAQHIVQAVRAKQANIRLNANNQYPCVLLETPLLPTATDIEDKKRRETAITCWTTFVIAHLLGLINYLAWSQGIPIEIVMRSSFGHYLPAVAECGRSIRIDMGLVPTAYLDVIVEAIEQLYEVFDHEYLVQLQKKRVPRRYSEVLNLYYGEECTPATEQWAWLWSKADKKGKAAIFQITQRKHIHLEAIADETYAIARKFNTDKSKRRSAFIGLVGELATGFKVEKQRLTFLTPDKWFRKTKRNRDIAKQEPVYDEEFFLMLRSYLESLGGESQKFTTSISGLFRYIDSCHQKLSRYAAHHFFQVDGDGPGSDSETECDIGEGQSKRHLVSRKIVTNSGMRAIHLSRRCAELWYGRRVPSKEIKICHMYYETAEALKKVEIRLDIGRAARLDQRGNQTDELPIKILYFDLNYCNVDQDPLSPEPSFEQYHIVVLDHTSSVSERVREYVDRILLRSQDTEVQVLMLVSSGLKHEQGGADQNSYGTIRIMSREKVLTDRLYEGLVATEGSYKHPGESHAIRRAYKNFGFLARTKNLIPRASALLDQIDREPELKVGSNYKLGTNPP